MVTESKNHRAGGLVPDYVSWSDEDIVKAIWEKLREDGRIDLQELNVSCRKGIVELRGALPSKNEHAVLQELVEDVMGFRDVVDAVQINRILWERRVRNKGEQTEEGKTEEEVLLQGEDVADDFFGAVEDGVPVAPPDELVPEK